MENQTEIWQTEVNGQVYETDFAGLTQWIAEGALLPQDKVRRGNLRWIEANKVPALYGFFNAKQLGIAPPVVTTTSHTENHPAPPPPTTFNNFAPQPANNFNAPPPPNLYQELTAPTQVNFCAIHKDAKAAFHCETCANYFCKACPLGEICPMCGATCQMLSQPSFQSPPVQPAFNTYPAQFNNQPAPVDYVDEEVLKAANWFFWKAGLTVINTIVIANGYFWSFYLGLTITQFIQGIAIGVTEEVGESSGSMFTGIAFIISIFCALMVAGLGYFGRQGKRWALILGMLIFCFDALLYLLSFSIFGVIIHGIAIYMIAQGISASKK